MKKILILLLIIFLAGCTTQEELPPIEFEPEIVEEEEVIEEPAVETTTSPETPQDLPEVQEQSTVKEFNMIAKQWDFEPSTITVNQGDQVRLIIESVDVAHGISIPDFNINERLEPEEEVTIEFTADKKGTFNFRCSVFCGSGHGGMTGTLIVE